MIESLNGVVEEEGLEEYLEWVWVKRNLILLLLLMFQSRRPMIL